MTPADFYAAWFGSLGIVLFVAIVRRIIKQSTGL